MESLKSLTLNGYTMAELAVTMLILGSLTSIALLHSEVGPSTQANSQKQQLISHLHLAKMTATHTGNSFGLEFPGWIATSNPPLAPHQYRFIDALGNPVIPKGLQVSTFTIDQKLTHGLSPNAADVYTQLSSNQNPLMFDRMGVPSQFDGTEIATPTTLLLTTTSDPGGTISTQTLTITPHTGSITPP